MGMGCFPTGGGDRNLGDVGQRGVSLGSSEVIDGFWGAAALVGGSEVAGFKLGIEATDSARCCAAADGGLVFALVDRDGMVSFALFFLDLPVRVVVALVPGLTGDDSLEGTGEFVADAVRVGRSRFVFKEDVDESRVSLGVAEIKGSLEGSEAESLGSEVCWFRPEREVDDLSAIVAVLCGFQGRIGSHMWWC